MKSSSTRRAGKGKIAVLTQIHRRSGRIINHRRREWGEAAANGNIAGKASSETDRILSRPQPATGVLTRVPCGRCVAQGTAPEGTAPRAPRGPPHEGRHRIHDLAGRRKRTLLRLRSWPPGCNAVNIGRRARTNQATRMPQPNRVSRGAIVCHAAASDVDHK
jgi:hypothetical protein